jgi:hypothetical protein
VEFLAQNQLYIVMVIVVGIWAGIWMYLSRLGSRIARLEAAAGRGKGQEKQA